MEKMNRRNWLVRLAQYGSGLLLPTQLFGYKICFYGQQLARTMAWVEDKAGNCIGFLDWAFRFTRL